MSAKNQIQVVIGGNVFVIGGYESEEYIQKVAFYLNSRLSELQKTDGYRRIPAEKKNVLVQLNIADDYFKAKQQTELLENGITQREQEIFELKRKIMELTLELEEAKKEKRQND